LKVVDKNAATLAKLEKEKNQNSIEVVSNIKKEDINKEDISDIKKEEKQVKNKNNEENQAQNQKNKIDKQISAAIVDIQEIKKENQNQADIAVQKKIEEQKNIEKQKKEAEKKPV